MNDSAAKRFLQEHKRLRAVHQPTNSRNVKRRLLEAEWDIFLLRDMRTANALGFNGVKKLVTCLWVMRL